MTAPFRIAIAQLDPHQGEIAQNLALIRAARAAAAGAGADLVVTPEFSIAGYPPEDLVLKPAFVAACDAAVAALAAETADGGPALIVGGPWAGDWAAQGAVHNTAFLLDAGAVQARRAKHALPNYGVFDDRRVFVPGPVPAPVDFRGHRLGLMICEDWWFPDSARALTDSGAALLLSINGSPYEDGKSGRRVELALRRVAETGRAFVFCAQVCGQDELVFDGASFVLNPDGSRAVQLPSFEPALVMTEWRQEGGRLVCTQQALPPAADPREQNYRCLMLGLADYVEKNRFPGVILGLSGGIDSALSAAIAADALGPARVRAVMLPSPYTSHESLEDARECARLLGIGYETIPIAPAMAAMAATLAPQFTGTEPGTTEENLQSRIRGMILMALSNKFGDMLLTTGNKSEMSVGYATLYGDMCGGYSVLKDVYKTSVFALSRWRNSQVPPHARGPAGRVMPERVITKPPSAELRPDQKDEDSLPPYDVLDAILENLIERERGVDDLAADGFDRATVLRVWRLLDRAEYKRRQAPPGVKLTARAFGRDRRYPITNGFTDLVS